MRSVVDISCFSSGKRLGMRVFGDLRVWVRLAGQTVGSYRYGLKDTRTYTLWCNVQEHGQKCRENLKNKARPAKP